MNKNILISVIPTIIIIAILIFSAISFKIKMNKYDEEYELTKKMLQVSYTVNLMMDEVANLRSYLRYKDINSDNKETVIDDGTRAMFARMMEVYCELLLKNPELIDIDKFKERYKKYLTDTYVQLNNDPGYTLDNNARRFKSIIAVYEKYFMGDDKNEKTSRDNRVLENTSGK